MACKQPRHQRVALFSTFRLKDIVRPAGSVVKKVRAFLAVELAHERDQSREAVVPAKAFENGGP